MFPDFLGCCHALEYVKDCIYLVMLFRFVNSDLFARPILLVGLGISFYD